LTEPFLGEPSTTQSHSLSPFSLRNRDGTSVQLIDTGGLYPTFTSTTTEPQIPPERPYSEQELELLDGIQFSIDEITTELSLPQTDIAQPNLDGCWTPDESTFIQEDINPSTISYASTTNTENETSPPKTWTCIHCSKQFPKRCDMKQVQPPPDDHLLEEADYCSLANTESHTTGRSGAMSQAATLPASPTRKT
jgi:hypothetical protein